MKRFVLAYLGTWIVACGGDPFVASTLLEDAAPGGPVDSGGAELDAGPPDARPEASTPLEPEDLDASRIDTGIMVDAGAGDGNAVDSPAESSRSSTDAGAGDPDAGELVDAAGDVDASLACDPAYGDASPGGPCCVHVWATPTMGTVLCTVDGSRWCWQTGMPCSTPGSRCVTQGGVTYCAP